jgi:hypothetical protein
VPKYHLGWHEALADEPARPVGIGKQRVENDRALLKPAGKPDPLGGVEYDRYRVKPPGMAAVGRPPARASGGRRGITRVPVAGHGTAVVDPVIMNEALYLCPRREEPA